MLRDARDVWFLSPCLSADFDLKSTNASATLTLQLVHIFCLFYRRVNWQLISGQQPLYRRIQLCGNFSAKVDKHFMSAKLLIY